MLLEFSEGRARFLGENLGIRDDIIEALEYDAKNNCSLRFSKVINYWLNNDPEHPGRS